MSERTQRVLWAILAVIAIGLSAVTIYLYQVSRHLSSTRAGLFIAYVHFSDSEGLPRLYICDVRSGESRPLSESQIVGALPVCEPVPTSSGKEPRIAFIGFEMDPGSGRSTGEGTPGGVYVVSSKGGKVTKVSGSVQRIWAVAPAWSPDGKQLAFAGLEDLNGDGKFTRDETGIYVSEVETGQARRIATANVEGLRLSWSPAGPQLLLRVKKPDAPIPIAHVLDLQSGKWLFEGGPVAVITLACWSPDGQHVAAYSMIDNKIYIVRSDGSAEYSLDAPTGTAVNGHIYAHVIELLWTPKSMIDNAEDWGQLWVVSASQPTSGSGQLWTRPALPGGSETWKRLTDAESDAAYLAASPDGRYVAYTLASGHGPEPAADIYVLELGQTEPRRLTSDPGFEGMATWVSVGGE